MDFVFYGWNPIAPGDGTVDAGLSNQIAYLNGPKYTTAWGAFLCSAKGFSGSEKAVETGERTWQQCAGSQPPGDIPPGSVINTVQVTSIKRWLYRNQKLASHRFRVRLVESVSGVILHSEGDLIDAVLPVSLDSGLVEFGPGPVRVVDAIYSDAGVSWKWEFEYDIETESGGGKANTEWRFGGSGAPGEPTVQLKIGYTRP